jgi:hypothetical protein
MIGKMIRLALFLLVSILAGCSSGNPATDAGLDADAAGGDQPFDGNGDDPTGEDGIDGADAGDLRPDFDPSSEFLLTITPGTTLCHGFHQDRTWQQEWALVGQIELVPGQLTLPRQAGTSEGTLVQNIRLGPDRIAVQLVGSGEIVAEYKDWGDGEWWYLFRQNGSWEGSPCSVEVFLSIGYDGGWPAEIVTDHLDWPAVLSAKIWLGPGVDPLDEIQAFGLCELPEVLTTITATTENDDVVVLEERAGPYMRVCQAAGETSCLFLTRAEVTMGDFHQEITDRFLLVYSGSHHNWYDEFLLVLDPPDQDVAALLVIAPDFRMGGPGAVVYLNASLAEISRVSIKEWNVQP